MSVDEWCEAHSITKANYYYRMTEVAKRAWNRHLYRRKAFYESNGFKMLPFQVKEGIVMYDAMCVADREPEITRKECDELMKHYFGIWTFVIYVKKYTDKIAGVFDGK